MLSKLKAWLKSRLSAESLYSLAYFYHSNFGDFSQKTWAQHGEDVLIDTYFRKSNGFYIDIGAHHPRRYSNTYRLYRKNWRGIAIDPLPGLTRLFSKLRPRDTFLNMGVGHTEGQMDFYEFHDPAVSTFVATQADQAVRNGHKLKIKKSIPINVIQRVVSDYAAKTPIDLVNIDAEGMDEIILQTWPFEMQKPKMFVIEKLETTDPEPPEILKKHGYSFYSRAGSSFLYTC